MKILYDHQIFSASKFGGISRYHIELFKQARSYEDVSCQLLCRYSNNELLLQSGLFPVRPFLPDLDFKGKVRLISALNTIYCKKKIRSTPFDVFHPTFYGDYFLPYINHKPFVLTCHDLIHEKFGDQFAYLKKDIFQKQGKKRILDQSSMIISVSENTKKDLIELYGIAPEKIKVIYLAYEQENKELAIQNIPKLPLEYLLYVGVRTGYKNFMFFTEAISQVLKKNKDLFLVCAGGGPFHPEELALFSKLGIRNRVVFQPLNEHNLSYIYSHARAFFFPSYYEGFGIPVLEAFYNHCPALLSDKGSLPEIGGNAAMYFDPYDSESIISAAEKVLYDDALQGEMKAKGALRAQVFSWEKTALQTFEVYRKVMGDSQ